MFVDFDNENVTDNIKLPGEGMLGGGGAIVRECYGYMISYSILLIFSENNICLL